MKFSSPVRRMKKGDKLKIKLKNGKKFDVVFVDYSRTKGIAYGKFKDGGEVVTKPFSLDFIVESVNEETYKVAGRPVTLIKGKKSNGFDWKVKFQNGKETSLIDVIALIKPFPPITNKRVNEESSEEILKGLREMALGDLERIADYANMISDRMNEGQELSSWMYSQITLAVDQLNSVHDSMDGKDGIKEAHDCGCGCKGTTVGGCNTSLTEVQLNEWRAEEVLQQLGGRKFIAMTGAKNFVKNDKDKSIVFRVPKAKNSINTIRITLTSMDVYNVDFISVRGTNIKTVATAKGVYNDQLQSIFTKYTGLYTSL